MPTLYSPFKKFRFDNLHCFLTGAPIAVDSTITVFPQWLLDRYDLADQPFKLLDESIATYKDLTLPCSEAVRLAYDELDQKVSKAFDGGYEALAQLSDQELFLWTGKLVYGIIFNEIRKGIRQQQAVGEAFDLSQAMAYKFGNLHQMLQSLVTPITFEGAQPFSVLKFKVDNPPKSFSYRDEINTLIFSMMAEDFGLLVCLQDNGANQIYHRSVLEQLADKTLAQIQFEEVAARFFYSGFLFNRLPEYTIVPTEEEIFLEPMPLRGISNKPLFDHWDPKTFGKVLEAFWKNWGFTLFEIIKNPEEPKSFLFDANGQFVDPKDIAIQIPGN